MDARVRHSERYGILDLELDVGRQLVTRGGAELHVPKLSFDLLLALIRAAPNLVTAADLMEQVWPQQVVGIETVTQRIKLLRKALGDDANQPRYVVGERRRGYRMLAPVICLPPTAMASRGAEPLISDAVPPMNPWRRLGFRGGVASGVCVVVAAAMIAGIAWKHDEPTSSQHAQSAAPGVTPPFSVALLPFEATNTPEKDARVAAGLAELVENRLRGERELTVYAAGAPHAGESALDIAKRLGARYAVEGTVQYQERALRVTANVLEVATGKRMGAVLVERPAGELFRLQDDVADRITTLIIGRTRPEGPLAPEYGSDAMLAYLRGRALLATRKQSDAAAAVSEFSRAAQLAPTFAAAHAGIAEARFESAFRVNRLQENADRLSRQMAGSIDRALELDPNNGPALFIRAKYREMYGNSDDARADYERAMSLAPGFSPGIAYYADFLWYGEGDTDKALAVLDSAIRVDPLAPRLTYMKGMFLQFRHEDDAAAALLLQTIRVAPQYTAAYNRLAELRWAQGQVREALSYAEQSVQIEPADAWSRANLARIYIDVDDLAAADDVLAGFDLPSNFELRSLGCYRDGKLDAAYEWLRPALQNAHVDGSAPALAASLTALVEWAGKTRRFDAARRRLLSMPWLKDEQGELDYSYANAAPLLQLATLEQLAGDEDRAREMASRVLAIPDTPSGNDSPRRFTGVLERNHMLALAILGRDEEAISELVKIRGGFARQLWWAWIERHPAMSRLRHDPRVQDILEELRAWSLRERASVEAERAAGRLPTHTGTAYRCLAPPKIRPGIS